MTSSLVVVVGGAMSCFAVGWCVGRGIKTLRQFFDFI